jgi:nucleoside 2-deoxyribosyltransferase
MPQVYCAGPLFNEAERREMVEIANILEHSGYSTFLPHRDGLEFSHLHAIMQTLGMTSDVADKVVQHAIFSLDVYQLLSRSDVVVANLNGRVPDEGTVVEAALAWHSGKGLVLYKADERSMLSGSDNPMIIGLGSFNVVNELHHLPDAIRLELSVSRQERIAQVLKIGEQIAIAREKQASQIDIAKYLKAAFSSTQKGTL